MPSTPAFPRISSRHPVVIGALEALRVVLALGLTVLVVAVVAWFVAIAQLQPLRMVPVWAGTLLAASSGWELSGGWGLPPTLLSLGLFAVVVSGLRRTRRALAANEVLVRSGSLPATRYAATTGLVTCLVLVVAFLVLAGLLVGAGRFTGLGAVRFVFLLAAASLVAVLGPDRRRGTASRWALALLDTVADRAGAAWADAIEGAVLVLRRVGAAAAIVAVAGLLVALATGWSAMGEALSGYTDPTAAGLGLGAVQLLFVPTLLQLARSWMSGAGIQLSTVAVASPFTDQAALVPAVPVLAAIPTGSPVWGWAFVLVLPLAAGVATAGRRQWVDVLDWRTVVLTAGGIVCVTAGLSLFATGAVGPAGLEAFGAPVLATTGLVSAGAIAGVAGAWGLSLLANRAAADR
jgi:hypothetical protein